MADYGELMRGENSGAEWHFLTTRSQTELRPILDAYGQAVDRKANPADPTGPLNHTLRVFLIDRTGNIRNIYSSGTLDVLLVLADVRTLLLESSPPSPPAVTPAQVAPKPPEITAPDQVRLVNVPVLAQKQIDLNPAIINP
jgi:hypothetical protein